MTWAVGACRTRRELPLAESLIEEGIDAYTPVLKQDTARFAVFPGYLFIRSGEGDQGVVSVKAFAMERFNVYIHYLSPGRVGEVTDDYIETLKAKEKNNAFDRPMKVENNWYKIGEMVTVTSGSACGLSAVILGFRGKRARLDLPLLGDRCWFPTVNLKRAENGV